MGFEDVSIKLSHDYDDRGEYNAFTSISVDIFVRKNNTEKEKAGSITGVLVFRQMIPEGMFLSAMDGHSHEMQMVATGVFEPRMGRTKLISLRDGGDDYEKDILYIESIHVDDRYKVKGNSDVGSYAIRKLLRHDNMMKGGGIWCGISSCIYILDPAEAMTREAKEKCEADGERHMREQMMSSHGEERSSDKDEEVGVGVEDRLRKMRTDYARLDANQFLRNGFYQDVAVAKDQDSFIIVAASKHWKKPMKSHSRVAEVKFFTTDDRNFEVPTPVGKDAEILKLTKQMCREDTSVITGQERVSSYRAELSRLVSGGGSLAKSHALHAACAISDGFIVKCILEMNPAALESRDVHNVTPLMMAASVMAGKSNNSGFPSQHPVIDALLEAGADKDATDSDGLTAYGNFKSNHRNYQRSIQAMTGEAVSDIRVPGLDTLERKLMPSGGATDADRACGEGAERGYIEYEDSYDY